MHSRKASQITDELESEKASSELDSALDQGLGMMQKLEDKNFKTMGGTFFNGHQSAVSTDFGG